MKNLLLIISIVFASNIYGQTTYRSSVTTTSEGEVIEKQRIITISDTEITITNFLGGTKTLTLKVNDIKEKEYFDRLMKWYYCTSTDKDFITGKNTEYIIIMKKSYPSDMTVCQKIDEVTFIKTVFSLR
ncbi:MAG TPA: hypothetical protein DCR40_00895 [Prolixibacteraceae bacterium]|nr:hypothetical protein [Prolixibacteraceae bacterium]